jgi:hypothetical protein
MPSEVTKDLTNQLKHYQQPELSQHLASPPAN